MHSIAVQHLKCMKNSSILTKITKQKLKCTCEMWNIKSHAFHLYKRISDALPCGMNLQFHM